jgi:hypothetical protein
MIAINALQRQCLPKHLLRAAVRARTQEYSTGDVMVGGWLRLCEDLLRELVRVVEQVKRRKPRHEVLRDRMGSRDYRSVGAARERTAQ